MTAEEQTLLMVKGSISDLPAEDRAKVDEVMAKFTKLIEEYPFHGHIAIALIGAKLAAETK